MKKREVPILFIVLFVILFVWGCVGVLMQANTKLDQGKYTEAIPLYLEHLAKERTDTEAKSKLGFAYLKTGRIDEAVAEFNSVLAAKPGDPYAVLYLGLAYINKEQFGKAIEIWKGYRDKKNPLVETEIKRQLTLLLIADSQRQAAKALAEEKKIQTIPKKDSIAVCYYADLSPDKTLRAFQKGLAAMVNTDLSKIKSLTVLERMRLQALLQEMQLGQTGIVEAATAPRIGRLLGAENLIVGSIMVGSFQVTTSLSSTIKGGVQGTIQATVEKNQFFQLPKMIVQDSAKVLGLKLSPQEVAAIGVPQTKNFKAFTYFGQALDAIDAGKWKNAKDLFAKALKEDPEFDAAREGLESTPDAGSPGINDLKAMSGKQIAQTSETGLNKAISEQETPSKATPSASKKDTVDEEPEEGSEEEGGDGH
ncbi:tetratricopeptide repeat protein [Thermodesulfobacteriota bacterium]